MSLQEAQEFVMKLRSTFSTIQNLSMPTVALIEGPAMGGGAELALACDFRICSAFAIHIFAMSPCVLGWPTSWWCLMRSI